jgi:hypothetical protein
MVMRIVSVMAVLIMSMVAIQLLYKIYQNPTVFLDRVFTSPLVNVEYPKKLVGFSSIK